jgi:hypothetical protein
MVGVNKKNPSSAKWWGRFIKPTTRESSAAFLKSEFIKQKQPRNHDRDDIQLIYKKAQSSAG